MNGNGLFYISFFLLMVRLAWICSFYTIQIIPFITESNRELGSQLIERLRSEGLINVDRLFDGVKLVSEVEVLQVLEIQLLLTEFHLSVSGLCCTVLKVHQILK